MNLTDAPREEDLTKLYTWVNDYMRIWARDAIKRSEVENEADLVSFVKGFLREGIKEQVEQQQGWEVSQQKYLPLLGGTPDVIVTFNGLLIWAFEIKFFLTGSIDWKGVKRDREKLKKIKSIFANSVENSFLVYAIDALKMPLKKRGGSCPNENLSDLNYKDLYVINHWSCGLVRRAKWEEWVSGDFYYMEIPIVLGYSDRPAR